MSKWLTKLRYLFGGVWLDKGQIVLDGFVDCGPPNWGFYVFCVHRLDRAEITEDVGAMLVSIWRAC